MTYSRGEVPSPVALADWMNAGRCPTEARHEGGRLFVDLRLAVPRAKLGKDVQWASAEDYRPALSRLVVNADGILCRWRYYPEYAEDWDDDPDADWSGMADWWDSMPLAERPIEADWDDLPRSKRGRVIKNPSTLDSLVNQWNATPESERPKHFPLDPVVQAWIKSRGNPVLNADAQPDRELSVEDYMPDWQRYQHDVRQAVEKDANGQDVHTALERAEDIVDQLVGLLRAANCELHQGSCPIEKYATEYIKKKLIPRLGRLGDLEHTRVQLALDYAWWRGKYKNLKGMYKKRRRQIAPDDISMLRL